MCQRRRFLVPVASKRPPPAMCAWRVCAEQHPELPLQGLRVPQRPLTLGTHPLISLRPMRASSGVLLLLACWSAQHGVLSAVDPGGTQMPKGRTSLQMLEGRGPAGSIASRHVGGSMPGPSRLLLAVLLGCCGEKVCVWAAVAGPPGCHVRKNHHS